MKTIQLAVRDFALPLPRRGSIDVHSGYGLLNQGQEIHEEIQQQRKKEYPYYRSEVKISHNFEIEDYKFAVSGRIDGIFDQHPVLIEEIKSTVNIHQLKAKLELNADHPYILQAKTYAYLYYKQHALIPELRLHLVSSTNKQQSEDFALKLDLQEYESWLEKRLQELQADMQKLEADIMRRIEIASKLEFPFKHAREGQLDLMASVENAIKERKHLLVQAATGLGKTMAISFPSLKEALARGQKLIYVTPKNSQHSVAEDAVEHLKKQGQNLKALTLNAKSKICFKPEPICTPEYCEYARDYYEKVYEHKLIDLMAEKAQLNFDAFRAIGEEFQVCPFELSVDAIGRADIIVGDYNYVFSPRSLIGRITQLNDLIHEKPNLVIDEAHNLPDRACDYYSPAISTLSFDDALQQTKLLPPGLSIEAQAIIQKSIAIIKSSADTKRKESKISLNPDLFSEQDKRWKEFLARYLQSGQDTQSKDAIVRAANAWSQFTESIGNDGDNFFVTSKHNPKFTELKITCCDASAYLSDTYSEFANAVAFSATLKPFDYYSRLIGFKSENTLTTEKNSPFPKENRKLLVIPQVSTKYSDRARNYDKIAEAIKRITAIRPGNYFAFFPSFDFLSEVA
ncbi:MAG: DEAD/DEAH box helicase, partial [Candidatus Obscuribacterales bacterium]|nr:DEAD/DEAH box helicase [Candidatus Obscuribacterales bacterium]